MADNPRNRIQDTAQTATEGAQGLMDTAKGGIRSASDTASQLASQAKERVGEWTNQASENIGSAGEAVRDWQPDGQFDVVVATGAVAETPARWFGWLKPGGRLLVIRGESPAQQAVLIVHEGEGRQREQSLFETDLPYLAHAAPSSRFVF